MAKSSGPLIIGLGAAALLLMGGKKKKSTKRSCKIIRSYEEFLAMIDTREFMPYPAAVILYPEGKSEQGEELCRSMAKSGAATVVSSSANEAKWILDLIESDAYTSYGGATLSIEGLPLTLEGMTKHVEGIMVAFSDEDRIFTPWESIPWDDVKSILKRG